MPQYRAAWLLPISQPPVRDGWVRTERGRITAFGPHRRGERTPVDEIDLGEVAILPGLVNAHTHLELSWMRGRLAPAVDFPGWICDLIALQRSRSDRDAAETQESIGAAIADARDTGTVLFGDISNTMASAAGLIERGAAAVVFHELIGFKSDLAPTIVEDALRQLERQQANDLIRYSLAAHAPYSVSPALFQSIRQALRRDPFARCSVHLGESHAEAQFLRDGTGPWRKLLEDLGAWDPTWVAPGCGGAEYLDRMGFLGRRLLAVHGVQFGRQELERLRARDVTLVTCPRGSALTGAGKPPVVAFYGAGVRVAIGTDSLASVPDLNLFSELAELRRLAPELPARTLIESATINGARALGFESDFGAIEPGKRDHLIAVDVHGAVADVEERLLAGVRPDEVRRIDS
jgi:cytosine/adenosine deaminase-related metal-dependent hydrolase